MEMIVCWVVAVLMAVVASVWEVKQISEEYEEEED